MWTSYWVPRQEYIIIWLLSVKAVGNLALTMPQQYNLFIVMSSILLYAFKVINMPRDWSTSFYHVLYYMNVTTVVSRTVLIWWFIFGSDYSSTLFFTHIVNKKMSFIFCYSSSKRLSYSANLQPSDMMCTYSVCWVVKMNMQLSLKTVCVKRLKNSKCLKDFFSN